KLLVVRAGAWSGEAGMNLSYLPIATNKYSRRESADTAQHRQCLRCTFLIARSGDYKIVGHAKTFGHTRYAFAGVFKVGTGFKGQPNNGHIAVFVALIPLDQEFRLVHAVGTPGSEQLKDDDLVAVFLVGRVDRAAFEVGKAHVYGRKSFTHNGQSLRIGEGSFGIKCGCPLPVKCLA